MSRLLLSRRSLLKSAASMALLAPVLRMRDARGAGGPLSPRRVILIFSPNGPISATGPASGSENAFSVHDWWKPLERHKDDAVFLSHLSATGASVVSGNGHGLGGQCFSGYGVTSDQYAAAGETIDQVIAKRLEAEGRAGIARSVAWGLAGGGYGGFWSGPGRTIVPELDPSRAWASLFSSFMGPTTSPEDQARAAAAIARQKSVLDFVSQDCAALRDALGAEGMRLLDDHCTTLRTMEKNVGATLSGADACTKPNDPGQRDWTDPENVDDQSAAFVDLAATTLACELSHVIAFQYGGQGERLHLASKYGVPSSPQADSGDSGPAHHPWTHQDSHDPTMQSAMKIFTTFYANQVALLVDKLKTTIDASGNPLIDSTVVLWLSELGGVEGGGSGDAGHCTGSVPAVLIGRGQGTFRTGRYLQGSSQGGNPGDAEGGREMARLLVSIVQYMGLTDVTTVGNAGVNGPLTALY